MRLGMAIRIARVRRSCFPESSLVRESEMTELEKILQQLRNNKKTMDSMSKRIGELETRLLAADGEQWKKLFKTFEKQKRH